MAAATAATLKSLPRLVTHILICVVAGFLYAFLYIQLMLLLVN
jgi:hypothetical protein